MNSRLGIRILEDDRPLELEHGGRLPSLEIGYESWGRLAAAKDNAILVCPAFSAHSHAQSHAANPEPGWWEGMIGRGLAIDPDRFFVLCPALLGGSYQTTGPGATDPRTGKPYGGAFPEISVRDIVRVHVRLLDLLGIERLYAVLGGSLGGMEAAELAIHHPGRTARSITISATDRTRPYTAAIRHLGRRAIQLDPAYRGGDYGAEPPQEGLKLAREIGTLFYRSREEFNDRFKWQPIRRPTMDGVSFDVQSYLTYQGAKIVGKFDPNAYLTLSLAMDLHDVWRGYETWEQALEPVDTEFTVIGVEEDRLIPIDEQRSLHRHLREAGKKSRFHSVSSRIGHDAFLVELEMMTELIRPRLDR